MAVLSCCGGGFVNELVHRCRSQRSLVDCRGFFGVFKAKCAVSGASRDRAFDAIALLSFLDKVHINKSLSIGISLESRAGDHSSCEASSRHCVVGSW